MYHYLKLYAGERWANFLAPVLYVLMLLAVTYCIFEPQAEFNYLTL